MKIAILVILGVAAVAAAIAVAVKVIKASPEKRREMINKILFALALEAERLYGSKTGQAKKAQVIAWFYERYSWLSKFVTEEQLGEWIDAVVEAMTDWLASNPVAAENIGLRERGMPRTYEYDDDYSMRRRRDSRGRYSRDDGRDHMVNELEDMMGRAGTREDRERIQRMIDRLRSE